MAMFGVDNDITDMYMLVNILIQKTAAYLDVKIKLDIMTNHLIVLAQDHPNLLKDSILTMSQTSSDEVDLAPGSVSNIGSEESIPLKNVQLVHHPEDNTKSDMATLNSIEIVPTSMVMKDGDVPRTLIYGKLLLLLYNNEDDNAKMPAQQTEKSNNKNNNKKKNDTTVEQTQTTGSSKSAPSKGLNLIGSKDVNKNDQLNQTNCTTLGFTPVGNGIPIEATNLAADFDPVPTTNQFDILLYDDDDDNDDNERKTPTSVDLLAPPVKRAKEIKETPPILPSWHQFKSHLNRDQGKVNQQELRK